MKLRHAKRALSTVAFATVASAFVSLPFSNARAADYTVITEAEALALLGASGGDTIRKIDNGDGTHDMIHMFTNTASEMSFTIPANNRIVPGSLQFLAVGGGGAGSGNCGGGGGAGGLIYKEGQAVAAGTCAVVVGAGGAKSGGNALGGSGQNTTFQYAGTTYAAIGGGRGGNYGTKAGAAGGSGGGACGSSGPAGTANQPTSASGGEGHAGALGTNDNKGGGGGGAGSAGKAASGNNGGAGGAGLEFDISGETREYAAGGGGAGISGGAAGAAGGVTAGAGTKGTTNLTGGSGVPGSGSGGGGAAGGGGTSYGGAGGSGIVIVRYTVTEWVSVEVGGQTVKVKKAETSRIGDELVIKYTDPEVAGGLVLPGYVNAWVLAVGGGGAGANPGAAAISLAGAAGGGAGGFVEDTNASLSAGTYAIMVGAGGLSPNAQGLGGNGGDSYISLDGAVIGTVAKGGGGGGYRSVGSAGGSGGGGSKANGGSGTAGQGNPGGRGGSYNQAGAGGGGAGGPGENVSAINKGSDGGDGKMSAITGTEVYYAAGGGGGSRTGTGGAGGSKGVGGTGGGGATDPGNGAENTGSGGGGGKLNTPGGAGGSGVVIIRIKAVMPEKPVAPEPILYDGEEHEVYPENAAYTLTGTAKATHAGDYSFTATLKSGYVWADGSSGAVTVNWKILKSTLVVTTFTQPGWQVGETPEEPVLVVTAGTGGPEVTLTSAQLSYQYAAAEAGPWSATRPSTAGTWYIRPVIAGGADFDAPTTVPVASFTLWNPEASPIEELGYHALLSVTSYTGAALEGFPMLVRLSENAPAGFKYNQALVDGSDLRFYAVDATGALVLTEGVAQPLPYDIESWNAGGETIVWVKVPRYENGPVAMMCWGPVAGKELPAQPPATDVWSAYAGVWHLSEEIDAEHASTAKSQDASPNANAATPTKGSAAGADLTQMVSIPAMIGNGRVNSSTTSIQQGNRLQAANKDKTNVGNVFTFSGWYKMFAKGQWPRLVGNKNNNDSAGWSIEMASGSSTKLYVRANSGATVDYGGDIADLTADWAYLTFVFDGTSAKLYSNGVPVGTGTTIAAIVNGPYALAFGSNGNGGEWSLNGAYDELRLRAEALSADWILADYLQVREGLTTFGPAIVTPNVILANFWRVEPTPVTAWSEGEKPTMDLGLPAYGTPYSVITAVNGEAWTNDAPTAAGAYTLVFHVDAGSTAPAGTWSWSALATEVIQVNVTAHSPRTDLSGTAGSATLSGRVLLANNEPGTVAPILDQDYNQTAESSPAIYWVHEGSAAPSAFPNLKDGANHILRAGAPVDELCGATNIWTLQDVYLGTTYNPAMSALKRRVCNLIPYSSTSAANEAGAMHLVMRNVETAVVYSPCYTNGIGTIYFDAVNGWTTEAGEGYKLVLEAVRGEAALSETIDEATWEAGRVTLHALKRDVAVSADFVAEDETAELALAVTNGQFSVENFYRVIASVECKEPIRFRIRRSAVPSTTAFTLDEGGFILLDNIVVSYPAMRADLKSYGWFDPAKGGKQTLGYENAWNVPFPSVKDALKPRADVDFYTNPGDVNADTNAFITSATLHYRWRYLDQKLGDWRAVSLDPDTLLAPGELDLSDARAVVTEADDDTRYLPGDVEFYYELVLNTPFYQFVDYAAVDGFRMADFYSEEVANVTNRASGTTFSSQGTDWFIRLREGQSNYEALDLEVWSPNEDGEFETEEVEVAPATADPEGEGGETPAPATEQRPKGVARIEMELVGNHVWRGYLKTLDPIAAGVRFRVKLQNLQEPESTEWATNTVTLALREAAPALPVSGILQETADGWTDLAVDAATGYLMFQVDDSTRSVTIVHADYQNFNTWNDANEGGLFVGSSTEDSEKAGASPRAREMQETFDDWLDMPATNVHWQESFTTTVQLEYPDYTTFASTDTPNGWNAGQGMWVYGNYKDARTGRALQMEGQGRGYLQFIDAALPPRGLKSISFKARLGQFINFGDFCYYDADSKMSMSNYTFTTRAAFDLNQGKNFTGNASLSLIAYYRPGVGCYEFRYEQAIADLNGASVKGPQNQGQVYSLYRWAYDKATGKMNRTHLGSITNSAVFKQNATWTNGSGGNYTPMYISVSNSTDGAACIMAGTMRNGMSPTAALTTMTSGKFDSICYRDNSASRLKSGSYGVLSANCDGVFLKPCQLVKPVPFNGDFKTNNKLDRYSNQGIRIDVTSPHECRSDIDPEGNDAWFVTPGRMEAFNESAAQWGLRSMTPMQELNIYTATAGKTDWKLLASTNFNSFGTAKSVVFNLYTTKDCSVKIAAAGSIDDLRTDLVIDDVELTQWRGDTWYNTDEMVKYIPNWTSEDEYKAHTNFIFTSAWIQNKGLLLSAKRTAPGTPASIRSPLFDGAYGRGIGLGMFSFSYANAHPEAKLLLQIATNVTYDAVANLDGVIDGGSWVTLTNFTFKGEASGTRSCYIGLHGVKGVMRLLVDTNTVAAAAASGDPKYGEIHITEVFCRDEPSLDSGCWWGWNLRTLGPDVSGRDGEKRMYLPDLTTDVTKLGQSLALNNSVTVDTDTRDGQTYIQHQPFVQTPTFTSNIVGEVTFRARKYDGLAASQPAQVTLYGSRDGAENGTWSRLAYFAVSNTTYATYSYKTEPGQSYSAFRLAVTGVPGVIDTHVDNRAPEGFDEPVRVLIDEVLVSEAVRARVAFRNVGAFRGVAPASLNGTTFVPDVPSEKEQPLCNESWGVQCEVYAAQLPDEIDFTRTPRVKLYWFVGDSPWGFENWKTNRNCKSAYLSRATDTNLVYRSSYLTSQDAVISQLPTPGQVVQYSLEVEYYQVGAATPMTNVLSAADWSTPAWYKPVDHNRDHGGEFSAYNILDTVAPHWAWINEVNVFGGYDYNWDNSDKDYQFVEVAVPAEADITGWRVRLLEAQKGTDSVITNTLGIFGDGGLEATKPNLVGMASNMVFRVLANKGARTKGNLKTADGTLDGVWNIEYPTTVVSVSGEISAIDPIALQLVRASGIVEHEIVSMGTNIWSDLEYYSQQYHPTNTVAYLNAHLRDANFVYVGDDDGGLTQSRGVVNENGSTSNVWNNTMVRTPGRINEGQYINPNHPTPNGSSVLVYCNLAADPGHIYQTVGDHTATNGNVILVIQKGLIGGTNITYTVDPWYALGDVTANGRAMPATEAGKRTWTVNVADNASNNVTVVAAARVSDELLALGLTDDNRYRPAVMDWLSKHVDAYGNPWADPDADQVKLADYMSMSGHIVTNMTLTEMYWLDMDPTVGNLAFQAGMVEPPGPAIVEGYAGSASVTNVKMGVFMMITNRATAEAWSPYVLRGLEPGVTSWDYALEGEWGWTSVTFKVTGLLANGYTSESNRRNWIPLRWFVFHPDSFYQPGDTAGRPFTTRIEVKDPFGTETPGYSAGWYDWVREHGYTPVFFSWSLDERLKPFDVEVLKKQNYYEY